MVNAIPTANANPAGFGFGAMFPSWLPLLVPVPVLVPAAGFLEGLIGGVYELLHTSLRRFGSVFEMSQQSNFRNRAVVEKAGVRYRPNSPASLPGLLSCLAGVSRKVVLFCCCK